MHLQELIASHICRKLVHEDGSTTVLEVSFVGTRCRFEVIYSTGCRHIFEADLKDFDDEGIQFRLSSSGPVLILWSRFLLSVVENKAGTPQSGYTPQERTNQLYLPLRGDMPAKDKEDLRSALKEIASSGPSHSPSQFKIDELRAEISRYTTEVVLLTADVDFSLHDGRGVTEQKIAISDDGLDLVFHQRRATSRKSAGTYLDAIIPLWTLKSAEFFIPARVRRVLPSIMIHAAVNSPWPLRLNFSGPPPFIQEFSWEAVYCKSIPDCERLQSVFQSLIPVSRDLAHLLYS